MKTTQSRCIGLKLAQIVVFLIIISFISTPITQALAEETPRAPEAPAQTPAAPEQEPTSPEENTPATPEEKLPEGEELKEKPKEKPEVVALTAPEPNNEPKFQLPTQPKATVDQSTGALVYDYPIELLPGRNGLTPELSLRYNSRNISKPDSIAGLGWEVFLPYIQREPVKGTNNLYAKTFFSSSLSGNLVATTDTFSSQFTTYRPEADSGDYKKYTYNSDNSWTMTGKDGRTYTFGGSGASRQDNPADNSKVYKWMISKIVDAYGNEIQYSYIKHNGQIYPNDIRYAYHPQAGAVNTITFSYTTPLNYGTTVHSAAFPVTTSKLLNTIIVTTVIDSNTRTDTYTLFHQNAQFINQKLLRSVERLSSFPVVEFTQIFNDTTSFEYNTKTPGWEPSPSYTLETELENPNSFPLSNLVKSVDFDKNGYPDLMLSKLDNGHLNYLLLNNGSSFTNAYSSWGLPSTTTHNVVNSWAVTDLNGDRLPDLHPRQGTSLGLYLHTGSGFSSDTSGKFNVHTYVAPSSTCGPNVGDQQSSGSNIFLYDINGDSKNDILYFGGSNDFKVFLNNGNGFTASNAYTYSAQSGQSYSIPTQCNQVSSADNFRTLMDVNGDNLPDYIDQKHGTHLNTGSGFAYSAAYTFDLAEMDRTGFADLNGDSLIDYLSYKTYNSNDMCERVFLNTGSGFAMVNPEAFPPCANSQIWDPAELQYATLNSPRWGSLMDVTADGYPDIVGALSVGEIGKVRAISDGATSWFTANINGWTPIINPSDGMFFDINSDGVVDFITPEVGWDTMQMSNSKVYIGKPYVPDLLNKITTPLSAQTVIEYKITPANLDGAESIPVSTVSKITLQNIGHGQPGSVTRYSYDKGTYVSDPATLQRRFAGFHKVTATESGLDMSPLRISETYFHQGNGSDAATSEPGDSGLALVGRPYYSIVKDSSSSLKREIWNTYGEYNLVSEPAVGRFSKFVFPKEVVTKTTEPSATTGTAELYTFDTTLGEQIELRNLGFVTVNSNGSYADISGDTRYVFTEYAKNANSTIVEPKRVDIRPTPGATIHRTDYFYDNQSHGTIGAFGNLNKETKWISGNGAVTADTKYTYDAFGNILTITNPRNATTTYTYDNSKMYMATSTNPLGHKTTYTYLVGKIKQVTDPNGYVISYGYSSKGWPYRVTRKNTGGDQVTLQSLARIDNMWILESSARLVNNTQDRAFQSMDNIGRPVRAIRQRINHTTGSMGPYFLMEAKMYDALGREIKTSVPYGTSQTLGYVPLLSVSVPANLVTATNFDVFDRPTQVTNALGTTTLSYNGTETMTTDANGKKKKVTTDAYGNLTKVAEYDGKNTYNTLYAYDIRNLLTKLTDAVGNIRNFAYNNAGWLTNSEDLRAASDTTFGSTSFTYDPNGNQVVETQPNGTTVTRVYDLLDRPTSIDGSTTAGIEYTFTYDSCTNGKGHTCRVNGTLPNGVTLTKTYTYGISGIPTSTTLATLGTTYTTNYTYNFSDQVSKIIYPNGTTLRTTFGDWALPSNIYTTLPGGKETLHSTITYHHTGKPNSIKTPVPLISYTYDSEKLYRLKRKQALVPNMIYQDTNYTYDSVNNITRIVEVAGTKTYTYDDLYRLTQGVYTSKAAPVTYTYAYNPIGNITNANGQAYTYATPNKTNPHAVTSVGSQNYTYDDNGNLSSGPALLNIVNNWQNQPISLIGNGRTQITMYYDENAERFIYKTPATTEIQVNDTYIVRNNIPEITIKFGNTPIGTISNGNIYSTVSDHLDTPTKQISSTGTVVENTDYDPFGKLVAQGGTLNTKRGYTGHEEDIDTGLIYAEARYYNPAIMRFNQQDPLLKLPPLKLLIDPQQLNSYSYVRNNPVNGVDPKGTDVFTVGGTKFFGGGTKVDSDIVITNLAKDFPGQKIIDVRWDGADNSQARLDGAQMLAENITKYRSSPDAPVNIFSQSHGDGVVATYTQRPDSVRIHNLITFSPAGGDAYAVNEDKVDNHISIHTWKEIVRPLSGTYLSASSITGAAVGAAIGSIMPTVGTAGAAAIGFSAGYAAGWGEFGPVLGRKEADHDFDVSKDVNLYKFLFNHTSLYKNQKIWDKYVNNHISNK